MLQQTTVNSVLKHFERFLVIYPDVLSLALSSEEEILVAWKGLGYYRRAKNLRKAAVDIVDFYEGNIPENYDQLINISGIGDYTANAILSIGLNQKTFAIDANIERVLSRLGKLESNKGPKLHKEIKEHIYFWDQLEECEGRDLNEALMDLGRVYCRAKKVDCNKCPIKEHCQAFKEATPLDFPRDRKKIKPKMLKLELLRILVKKSKKIMVYQKNDEEWLSKQWEIPTFVINSENEKLNQYPLLSGTGKHNLKMENLKTFNSSITKYKISNKVINLTPAKFSKLIGSDSRYELLEIDEITQHLTTSSLKALESYS